MRNTVQYKINWMEAELITLAIPLQIVVMVGLVTMPRIQNGLPRVINTIDEMMMVNWAGKYRFWKGGYFLTW